MPAFAGRRPAKTLKYKIKTFFLLQQSKFDGKNQFLVAVAKQGRVLGIAGFNPSTNSLAVLKIKHSEVQPLSLGKTLGIVPDAKIELGPKTDFDDITDVLSSSILGYSSIKTDLTIVDIIRLLVYSKSVSLKDKTTDEITFPLQENQSDKIIAKLFSDHAITSENSSIQIINATDIPGLGKRLERVLVNIGGNVVSVSTSRTNDRSSKIQNFGQEQYTVEKLKKLLQFSTGTFQKQTIADIVITIGMDSAISSRF